MTPFKRSATERRKMLVKHTKARAQRNQRWAAHKKVQKRRLFEARQRIPAAREIRITPIVIGR